MKTPDFARNKLLSALSARDRRLLQPHLHSVSLAAHSVIDEPGKPIRHVFFIEDGLLSEVKSDVSGRAAEVGLIGNEGMTGITVVLSDNRSTTRTSIQIVRRQDF